MELLRAFRSLSPQDNLQWGFDDAMRRLSEPRPIEETVGAWTGLPSELWQRGRATQVGERVAGRPANAVARVLAEDARRVTAAAVESASRATWDGLRYLAARVEVLEGRAAGASSVVRDLGSLAPTPDLTEVTTNVDAWIRSPDPTRAVFHGDCGEGVLLASIASRGFDVVGAEPDAGAVWRALDGEEPAGGGGPGTTGARGGGGPGPAGSRDIRLAPTIEALGGIDDRSLSGVVLSGCIDRADVTGSLLLLTEAVRVAGPGATVAVLCVDPAAWDASCPLPGRDLLPGRPLHAETWLLLLERSGVEELQWVRPTDGTRPRGRRDDAVVTGIHQFVPVLLRNDAVGEHTLALRNLLRRAGFDSRIYTETPFPATRDEARPYREYEADARPGDVLVYQFATRSGIADWLLGRTEPLVLNYHSVTPPESFTAWNNGSARLQVVCLEELARLAPHAVQGIAVSEFDGRELRAAGCPAVTVVPVVTVPGDPVAVDAEFAARLRGPWPATVDRSAGAGAPDGAQDGAPDGAGPGPLWLSVGRLAPNKAHEDTIAALFVARRTVDPGARLVVVGSVSERNYAGALRRYTSWLGLDHAVRFVSGLSASELAASDRGGHPGHAVRPRGLRGTTGRARATTCSAAGRRRNSAPTPTPRRPAGPRGPPSSGHEQGGDGVLVGLVGSEPPHREPQGAGSSPLLFPASGAPAPAPAPDRSTVAGQRPSKSGQANSHRPPPPGPRGP